MNISFSRTRDYSTGGALAERRRSAGDELVAAALVMVASVLQQIAPGGDVGPAAQQCAALPLGHASPHTKLNAIVEGVGEALGPHRAATADQLGPVLRRALDEELVRVSSLTRGTRSPVRDPHLAQLLRSSRPGAGDHARVAFSCGPEPTVGDRLR